MTGEVFFIQRVVSGISDVTQSDAVLSDWTTVLRWKRRDIKMYLYRRDVRLVNVTDKVCEFLIVYSLFLFHLYMLQQHKYLSHHSIESNWKLRYTERERTSGPKKSIIADLKTKCKRGVCIPWRCSDGCHGYPVLCKVAGIRRHRPHPPYHLSSASESKTCCLTDWGGHPETVEETHVCFGESSCHNPLIIKWVRTHLKSLGCLYPVQMGCFDPVLVLCFSKF